MLVLMQGVITQARSHFMCGLQIIQKPIGQGMQIARGFTRTQSCTCCLISTGTLRQANLDDIIIAILQRSSSGF